MDDIHHLYMIYIYTGILTMVKHRYGTPIWCSKEIDLETVGFNTMFIYWRLVLSQNGGLNKMDQHGNVH